MTFSDDDSTISNAATVALLASSVGDPEGTRTIVSVVVLLVVIGVALVMLAIWLFRLTRPDTELLAPLEVMGERKWRRADPVWQRRRLDEVRPPDAEPLQPSAAPPVFDEGFFEHVPAASGFDDLHEDAQANGEHSVHEVDRVAVGEAPATADAEHDAEHATDEPTTIDGNGEPAPVGASEPSEQLEQPEQPVPVRPTAPTPIGIERPELPERDIDPDVMAAAIAELDAELQLGRERRSQSPD